MKNPKNLTIVVEYDASETRLIFSKALKESKNTSAEREHIYYKTYIKHLFGGEYPLGIATILEKLEDMRETVQYRLENTEQSEVRLVGRLLDSNNYMSKNNSRPGVSVKLFRSFYTSDNAIIKVYVYDPKCASVAYSVESNFMNEALFQLYANRLHGKIDFISPHLYSWGQVRSYKYPGDNYEYKCLFLIMEEIPHLTLSRAMYTAENMRHIYARVEQIHYDLVKLGVHHNDLHGGNIVVKSPLPEIVLLDFGEASFGPRKPLFSNIR